jgi:tRNA A-37 threonylcarbamoyl transferase component Bud32
MNRAEPAAPQLDAAQRRFWLIVAATVVALAVVALVGGWTYLQVRGSLRDLRSAGLASLLEVEARALSLWVEEKQRDAERWAATPEVLRASLAIAAAAASGRPCAPPGQEALRAAIAPFATLEEVTVFNLILRDGRIASSPRPANCGAMVAGSFRQRLAPAFEGGTVFAGPWTEAERLGDAAAGDERLVWIEAPIRDGTGAVVATLGFGRPAAPRFSQLLRLTAPGTSRDAYAFDGDGRLVTEPRHAAGADVREPAGELTALAREALSRQASRGVMIEPYRNYRGTDVIGAWRWLPGPRLFVAVEVDAAEAFGPLEYLQVAFAVLLGLVLLATAAAASTSLWAMRLGLRAARRIGGYRIEEEIGEGGMSHVYRARHATLRRPAALKVLKSHLATDEAVTRFRREAQLVSQLEHPNTIEVYDYGTTRDGRWYYAMELLEGSSLEALVARDGPLPVGRTVYLLRQACGSLAEAHAMGLVHRDVKPGNLMVCVRGGQHDVLKVVDFGLVKELRGTATRDITQYSRMLGTPLYMAPERLRDPADADPRSDVYALGAVAWFALVGRPAFDAKSEHDILYKVMNEAAEPLAQARPDAPAALADLVARCLAKDREARPATMAEVAQVLEEVARAIPWGEAEARAWWEAHPEARGGGPALR